MGYGLRLHTRFKVCQKGYSNLEELYFISFRIVRQLYMEQSCTTFEQRDRSLVDMNTRRSK